MTKEYLLKKFAFEDGPLFFLVVFAFLLILKLSDKLLLISDILSEVRYDASFNELLWTILEVTKLRINLSPFSSSVLSSLEHRFGDGFPWLFFELSVLKEKNAVSIFVNLPCSFHLLNLQVSLFHSFLQLFYSLILGVDAEMVLFLVSIAKRSTITEIHVSSDFLLGFFLHLIFFDIVMNYFLQSFFLWNSWYLDFIKHLSAWICWFTQWALHFLWVFLFRWLNQSWFKFKRQFYYFLIG